MTVYVGIDPGASGGAVLINEQFDVLSVYSNDGNSLAYEALLIEKLGDRLTGISLSSREFYVVLEDVGAAPKQGSKSTARLCKSMGLYWGMLIQSGCFKSPKSAQVVRPSRWRRGLGMTSAYDKKDVHSLVKEIFKDDAVLISKDMADAAAIAVYCRKLCKG